jgi:hypothetical protein
MVRMAVCALPMWVRIRVGGAAKRITLGLSAGFGVAALLFLDLSAKQTEAALVQPFAFGDFDLMTGFTG